MLNALFDLTKKCIFPTTFDILVLKSGREAISIFITDSNSYLLSGELVTKLTGRYIEIEMMTLSFYEYVDMKRFLNKAVNENIYLEFEEYIRNGGFPKSLFYDNYEEKIIYTSSVINQIFEKDIKTSNRINDKALFERVQKFVINNFGAVISVKNIYNYLTKEVKINVNRMTIKRYLDILENVIYAYLKSKNYKLSVGYIRNL